MGRKESEFLKLKEKMLARQKNIEEQMVAALKADKAQTKYVEYEDYRFGFPPSTCFFVLVGLLLLLMFFVVVFVVV